MLQKGTLLEQCLTLLKKKKRLRGLGGGNRLNATNYQYRNRSEDQTEDSDKGQL